MDKEWCLEHDNDFREIEYKGVAVWVSPTGRIKTYNGMSKTIVEAAYWLCKNHKLPHDCYGEKSYSNIIDKLKKGWRGYIIKPVTNNTL